MKLQALIDFSCSKWDGLGENQEAVQVELGRRAFFEGDQDALKALIDDPQLYQAVASALLNRLASVRSTLVKFTFEKDGELYKASRQLESFLSDEQLEEIQNIQDEADRKITSIKRPLDLLGE